MSAADQKALSLIKQVNKLIQYLEYAHCHETLASLVKEATEHGIALEFEKSQEPHPALVV